MTQHLQLALVAADTLSAAAIIGSFTGLLPPLAALAAFVWYAFMIYDRIRYGPEMDGRALWWRDKTKKGIPDEWRD